MGLSTKDIQKPLVGVASCWNEAAPCNTALMRQAHAASEGVKKGDGTPREFCTITVTDGIAMGHEGMRSSLVSRDTIADSVELSMRGHSYDALVGIAGCDKSLPGMMMAMLRLNVPSVFLYGGSILPGSYEGRDVTVLDVFEAVGAHAAGSNSMTDEKLHAWRKWPVRAMVPVVASSRPIRWRVCPKPSALRCPCRLRCQPLHRPRWLRCGQRRSRDAAA